MYDNMSVSLLLNVGGKTSFYKFALIKKKEMKTYPLTLQPRHCHSRHLQVMLCNSFSPIAPLSTP